MRKIELGSCLPVFPIAENLDGLIVWEFLNCSSAHARDLALSISEDWEESKAVLKALTKNPIGPFTLIFIPDEELDGGVWSGKLAIADTSEHVSVERLLSLSHFDGVQILASLDAERPLAGLLPPKVHPDFFDKIITLAKPKHEHVFVNFGQTISELFQAPAHNRQHGAYHGRGGVFRKHLYFLGVAADQLGSYFSSESLRTKIQEIVKYWEAESSKEQPIRESDFLRSLAEIVSLVSGVPQDVALKWAHSRVELESFCQQHGYELGYSRSLLEGFGTDVKTDILGGLIKDEKQNTLDPLILGGVSFDRWLLALKQQICWLDFQLLWEVIENEKLPKQDALKK